MDATRTVAVIGGGPAGLMAAEVASAAGASVTVYEKMPSVGRKFLMAGRGGLNLTHSEGWGAFTARYGERTSALKPYLDAFDAEALRAWAEGLGQPTFIGSSGRVFPTAMKASPLLRAWLGRLAGQGVMIRTRMTWRGWDECGILVFDGLAGREAVRADAVVLALGGASWPRLGSDGAWAETLADAGADLAPFRPANVGFRVAWSEVFKDRFAGSPLKTVAFTFDRHTVRGEAVITARGIEGGVIYALSAWLRDAIEVEGSARLLIDLRPDLSGAALIERLSKPRGSGSLSNHLRKAGLTPLAIGLLREAKGGDLPCEPTALASLIKTCPITLTAAEPIERAISTAGGLRFEGLDGLSLVGRPDVFLAGEMLDWEAPTGGYLLQASFATGAAAGQPRQRLTERDDLHLTARHYGRVANPLA